MESHEWDERPEVDPAGARAALEDARGAQASLAARAASPPGYYLVVGIAAAALMVGISSAVRWWSIALIVAGILLLLWDMRWYTRHTGIVAMATLREPGAWAAWAMIATVILGVAVSTAVGDLLVGVVCGLVTVVVTGVLGPVWDRAWVRSLAQRP